MASYDYRKEKYIKVSVCGIESRFNDAKIDRDAVLDEKYLYEVAGDDNSGDEPARVRPVILVNFFGTLVCDCPLPADDDGVLWMADGDFYSCSSPRHSRIKTNTKYTLC